MKVMHVITGLAQGGAEGALSRLVLNDNQNTHCVVSLQDRGVHGDPIERGGIAVHALGMSRWRVTAQALMVLHRLMRQYRPDIVQTWMYHANLLGGMVARGAGIDKVVWGIRNGRRVVSPSTRLVDEACAALSGYVPRAIVSCSHEAANVHKALGYKSSKFVIIPNGYESSRLQPDEHGRARVRAELAVSDSEVLVGTVARWDPQKDHANLITALTLRPVTGIPNLRVVLIGPGIDQANTELKALLAARGLSSSVMLLGARSDIGAIMSALDLHVLPSCGEAFPNVVAEAMSCGTPSVVTNVGDAALIVGDTGWVVPASAPQALAGAIHEAVGALGDRRMWSSRQRSCRERILQRFSIAAMVNAYRDLWGQVGRATAVAV